jgi:hypothetical protein
MFDVSKLKRNAGLSALAVGAGLMVAGSPAMAFSVDGLYDAAEGYTGSIDLTGTFELEGGKNPPPALTVGGATLYYGQDTSDGGTNNVHLLFDFGRHIDDNSYGDGAIGWASDGNGSKNHSFKDLAGSDTLEFWVGDDVVEVDYLDKKSFTACVICADGEGNDAGERVANVASSLEFDVNTATVDTSTGVTDPVRTGDSGSSPVPTLGADTGNTPAQIAARYAEVEAVSNWEYDTIYEIELERSKFGDGPLNLAQIASAILGVPDTGNAIPLVHFSPNKMGKNKVTWTCTDIISIGSSNICASTPGDPGDPGDPSIPEPSTLAVFGVGLLGLGALQRRRRKVAKTE